METQAFKQLPDSIQNLVRYGIKLLDPKKVILFGSRARGDFRENSDYDIAFKQLKSPELWPEFSLKSQEEPITLLRVDLLEYEKCTPNYKENIDSEGRLLYEA